MGGQKASAEQRPRVEDFFFEWRCDHRGTFLDLSNNFGSLTGLDPSALLGQSSFGRPKVMPEDRVISAMLEAAAGNRPFQGIPVVLSDTSAVRKVLLSGRVSELRTAGEPVFEGYGICPDETLGDTLTIGASEDSFEVDKATILDRIQKLGRIGYSAMDPRSGRIVFYGPMRDILRIPDGDISLEQIRSRVLHEDLDAYDRARESALSSGRPVLVELRFGQDRSDCHHVRLQFEPVLASDGTVLSLYTVNQDITEHREAEKELLRAQELGRLGHWRRYTTDEPNFWSDALLDIFGVTDWRDKGELPTDFGERLIHPDDRPGFEALRQKAIDAGEDYSASVRAIRPDGKQVWIEIRGHPILDADGTCIGTLGTVQDITVYKELESQVLQSDRWFRRAQRLGGVGHWTYEPAEKRVYFSDQAQIIYDCVGTEFLSFEDAKERVIPEDRAIFDRMRDEITEGASGTEFEIRMARRDGSVVHILVACEFDYDESGELMRTFGVITDSTPRAEAEAARRDAEAVMTDIFENADSGILVRDLSGRFIRANTRAAIQLGLRIDDILGHTVDEILAKTDRLEPAEKFRDAALRVAATHGSVTYDYSYTPEAGGPTTEFRVVNFPISGTDGSVRGVASMRYDITEFVQAQAALKSLNESLEQTVRTRTQELRQSEERFRNIASASADWLWELDADLRLAWCSDNFFEQTGRNPQDYIGYPLTALVSDQERFVDQREAWAEFTAKLESRSPVRGIEIVRSHPMGQRIVRINARPVWNDGTFIGFQGSTTDITELKQAQTQLIESERLASLGGLVAGISHEINTPVGASYTVVTKLTRSLKELQDAYQTRSISQSLFSRVMSELGEGLGIIQRGLERTSELISHFKQVAVDQTSHKRRTFELSDITRDIVATMEATTAGRKVTIEAKVAEGIQLDSYPGPLGQVMINLIQNAIVHGLDGITDRDGRIRLSADLVDARTLSLTISDNGKGMPPNVTRRVFEPFFTTKFGKGGSGLGMHLVYSIVHGVLGGTVSVTSTPDEGTEVSILVPLTAPENPDRDEAAAE